MSIVHLGDIPLPQRNLKCLYVLGFPSVERPCSKLIYLHRKGPQVKKYSLTALLLSTLFAATSWAQDSGETKVQLYNGFGLDTAVVKWTVKRYDGLQTVKITNAVFMPWGSAVEFCRQNFGGHSGWRLATRRDAERFVNVTGAKSELFWIDERDTTYFLAPSRPQPEVRTRDHYPIESSDRQFLPLCVADGPAATPAVSPARFYLRLTQPLYELDDKRVELNKSAPGSAEARKAGAEYAALQAAAMSKMNEFRLQLEKSSPDSKDARIAGIYYREMLLEASKIEWGTKPAISKDVVAAAEKEWQARVRENEDPMPSERLYRALAKVADATKQDKGNKLTDGSNRPVLTRVEAKQPSAEDIPAREKAQAVERKRKADEAAIVRAREAEDKKKSQAREEVLRASCMKPENRNNCECGRFYPGSSGGTCSR